MILLMESYHKPEKIKIEQLNFVYLMMIMMMMRLGSVMMKLDHYIVMLLVMVEYQVQMILDL